MDDRVRIYELSRKMNIPNQDIITTLRELGYDVKSHSSTVDSNAVGLLIAALGKKAEAASDDGKPKKTGLASKVPPPPEKKDKVKPRVLSRYRKPTEDGAPAEVGGAYPAATGGLVSSTDYRATSSGVSQGGMSPLPASQISSTPRPPRPVTTELKTPVPDTAVAATPTAAPTAVTPAQPQPTTPEPANAQKPKPAQSPAPTPATPVVETPPPPPPEVAEPPVEEVGEEERQDKGIVARDVTPDAWSDESRYAPRAIRNLDKHFQDKKKDQSRAKRLKKVEEPETDELDEESEEEEAVAEQETPEQPANEVKDEASDKDLKTTDDKNRKPSREQHQRAVRPMSPSVPIRVAAPSMRATPPRPPKSHRHSTVTKGGPRKEEDKVSSKAPDKVEIPKVVTLSSNLTVQELSDKMHMPSTDIIKHLFMKGIMRTVNQVVELEVAKSLAQDLEYEVLEEEFRAPAAKDEVAHHDDDENRITRPPVVTIMGHVDHGKTSLLDAIRQTKLKLTEGEAGGITQHIGAYHVEVEHEDGVRQIVFLDTPGHEAFTAMRARGARATDIAVLVVAADDGVMPQTIEAIDHAKAANVPIIVAVNKIDRPSADPDRVLSQLMEHELLPDIYGGDTVTCNVSAKEMIGLDELLDMIILVADMQDLRANPEKPAHGVIVEAEKSIGRGPVATALVQNGTLREGDYLVVGSVGGRVRALFDDRGNRVKAAGPSMPVEVLGLDDVPRAGDPFEVVEDIQFMKHLVDERKDSQVIRRPQHVTLESLHDLLEAGEVKELNVIIKADVQGTAEAIADSVRKLSDEHVQVRVLRAASGNISENDVNLAASSDAIILGFNTQCDSKARVVAEENTVDVRSYTIIYQITDDLTRAIQGLLEPIRKEVKIGTAEVRQLFKVGKGLVIAGCMVLDGRITRGSIAKIERTGEVIFEGKVDTLKRFKDDVKEVATGFECGISFERFTDLQEGDKINAYVI
ncbi:MAG: translation initiation factor IF-2, partial [Cyanobacteria bacterium]|nr:translation initiation factor IF-2 [Cyanobacteriota bacterium]